MLDPKLLRSDPDRVREGIQAKNEARADLDRWLALDVERRALLTSLEKRKAERNEASRRIGSLRQAGTPSADLEESVRALGDAIQTEDARLREIDAELGELSLWFPNLPHPDVPRGGEDQNRVLRTWGEPVKHPFTARAHDALGESLGLFDFERATRMSGPAFAAFRGAGARLQRGLVQFMLDLHTREHGYVEVSTPYLVKAEALQGTGQLPKLAQDMYRTDVDGLYLIPTAEVSITNLYAGEILAEGDLTVNHVGFSPCFRRESGSYGKETRGLTRVHQFDKVEMVKFTHPARSAEEHEILLGNAEAVLRRLGLAYRVVLLASGDLSFAASKCYDLEVWAPGAGRWLEVSSCSNFEDFQARRADIRFRPAGGGKPEPVHTLNASGLALPRTIIALLETYQTERGTVTLPEALRPYLGGIAELS